MGFTSKGVQAKKPAPLPPRSEREWSKEQEAIFSEAAKGKGHLVVAALAGTGKTTTIVEALNHFPSTTRSILVAAFNKRIAEELKGRVTDSRTEVSTLHSLGFKFVRQNGGGQLDADGGKRIAKEAMASLGLAGGREAILSLHKLVDIAKSVMPYVVKTSELEDLAEDFDCLTQWPHSPLQLAAAALVCLESAKNQQGTLDFTDMIYLPLVRNLVTPSYDVVIIDEAQDMNFAQLELARRSCNKGGRIIVVGDRHQAIYGFRGADSGGMDRMKKELKAKELTLTTTYRCPQAVVKEANRIVPQLKAHPSNAVGLHGSILRSKLCASAQPGNFILSRANAPLLGVCLELVRSGKRAKIEGRDIGKGLSMLVQKLGGHDIDDMLGYLAEWERKRILRAKENTNLIALVTDQAEAIRFMAEDTDNLRELGPKIENMFQDVGAATDIIVCSTVHKAKGLETDRVFLLDWTFRKSGGEEANLEYVAITRAKKELIRVLKEE